MSTPPMPDTPQQDKAGRGYWDDLWGDTAVLEPVDPRRPGLSYFRDRAFHMLLKQTFAGRDTRSMRLVELGCAQSTWLPYFATEFGFSVTGLDYSELGCEQERAILAKAGVRGQVVCSDLFDPPEDLVNSFDAVVSFGLVEHFTDTAGCLTACARFLRPGGRMVTIVPNMHGLTGWLSRLLNRPVYDMHVPLVPRQLHDAHGAAGLVVQACDYLMGLNLSVVHVKPFRPRTIHRMFSAIFSGISKTAWLAETMGVPITPNSVTSPYVYCIADRPAAARPKYADTINGVETRR